MKPTSRSFSRIPYRSEALLRSKEGEIMAPIENLSLNGVLLKTDLKLDIGKDVEVIIFLADPASDLAVDLNGTVARHIPEGIAVQFTGMYLDTFTRLRDLIGESLGDRRKVIEEFISFMSK
jgi:hypothetical protein